MGSIVLLLNGGHFFRNAQMFGSPLASGGESYVNEAFTPAVFASNIIRNVSLHIGTPFMAINASVTKAILRLHDVLGIAANDPRTSAWMGQSDFAISRMDTVEDFAGNLLHGVLVIVSIADMLFQKSWRMRQHLIGYLVSLCATFVLFNLLLKWQPWHSRLHLPLFVLFVPFAAIIISQWLTRQVTYIMVLLLVGSLPWVLANQTRSIVPVFRQHKSIFAESRVEQYFQRAGRSLREPYLGVAAFVEKQNLHDIGLMLPYDPFEYQLWVLLKHGRTAMRLEHIEVKNVSSSALAPNSAKFVPEAIIRILGEKEQQRTELRMKEGVYVRAWYLDPVEVFVPEAIASALRSLSYARHRLHCVCITNPWHQRS